MSWNGGGAAVGSDEDWQRCENWLKYECKIPLGGVGYDDVDGFAQMMRDGVMLCHLLNHLRPNSVDPKSFSGRPQMSQFLCLKNIRVFLQTCKKVFGLKEGDLFEPHDLFDVNDFGKVIHTLSILSASKEVKKSGTKSFSALGSEYYNIHIRDDDDLIYNVVDTQSDEDEAEDIYGTLVDFKPQPSPVPLSKRDMCLNEILDTEENYVGVLRTIIEKFMRPLKSELKDEDLSIIFYKVPEMYEVNKAFFEDLKKTKLSKNSVRNTDLSGVTVPECFTRHKLKLCIYGEYCSHLTQAQDHIDHLTERDAQIRKTLVNLNDSARQGQFKLRDLLTVPVQRILKYHLLIKELSRHTEASHPEQEKIIEALDAMEDLSLYVNEYKRDVENVALIKEIETSIVDIAAYLPKNTCLKDYGRRIHDGELRVKAPREANYSVRYVFLFDYVILICKPKSDDTYNYKDALVLAAYSMEEEAPVKEGLFQQVYPFGLVEKKDKTKRYSLAGKTTDIRRKWMDAIYMAKDNFAPKDSITPTHDFRLSTMEGPIVCSVCQKLLRGVLNQGYKCDKTKQVVHKECISKASKPGIPGKRPPRINYEVPVPVVQPLAIPPRRDRPPVATPSASSGSAVRGSQLPPPADLSSYPWFAGNIDSREAATILERMSNGTFLIRCSPDPVTKEDKYALSIKYGDGRQTVKHIRFKKPADGCYCLTESIVFGSVPEIVQYYQQNSLVENFPLVPTNLKSPFKDGAPRVTSAGERAVNYCIALYDYCARETNQLSFSEDDRITIISKEDGHQLWWKGKLNGKIGYFPSNYVQEE